MVNKLDNLKLKEVNYIKTVYSFEFSLLNLIYDEYIDLHCEKHKERNSIFQIFIPIDSPANLLTQVHLLCP